MNDEQWREQLGIIFAIILILKSEIKHNFCYYSNSQIWNKTESNPNFYREKSGLINVIQIDSSIP